MISKILLGYILMVLGLFLMLYIVMRLLYQNKVIGDGSEFKVKKTGRRWTDPTRRSVKIDGDELKAQNKRARRDSFASGNFDKK